MILFDSVRQNIVKTLYCYKEGYYQIKEWLNDLKSKSLNPIYVTMDGEQGIMRAFRDTWCNIKIQRCLFHIQHEGCRWLRTYPKTEAGKNLKKLLLSLPRIRSVKDRKIFIDSFKMWLKEYESYVRSLPMNVKANYDLKRTVTLIKRALPDMFYYINDPNVKATSNILESLYGRIKKAYRQHNGLTHKHKIQFLKWFCYYENQHKTNTI
jgi:transposase-like protein